MFRLPANRISTLSSWAGGPQWLSIVLIAAVVIVLAFIPMPFNIGILFAPVATVILLLNPILLVLGLVISVPVQDVGPLPEDVPITVTRVFFGAALLLLPLILIRRQTPIRWSWILASLLGLMGAMLVSLLNAGDLGSSFEELYRWFVALVAIWLTLQFLETRRHIVIGLALIAILAIAQGGLGLGQAITGAGPSSFQIGAGFSRAFGTFGMPNSFAAYMEMVTLPLIPLSIWAGVRASAHVREYLRVRPSGFLASKELRSRAIVSAALFALFAIGMIIGLSAIAVSFSRGGWVGTIAGIAVIVILLGRRAILTTAVSALLLTFGLLIGASGAILTVIEERFVQLVDQVRIGDVRGMPVTDDNFAAIERMSHWQTAIAMWDQYPWLGVGVGNFDDRFTEFAVHPQFSESQGHAHNYYLHLLAETGLLGLAAYVVLAITVLVVGWRAYRHPDALARAIGIGVLGTTTALLVHNIFENLHVLNITVQMGFFWGIAILVTRLPSEESDTADESPSVHSPAMQYDSEGRNERSHDLRPSVSVREHN